MLLEEHHVMVDCLWRRSANVALLVYGKDGIEVHEALEPQKMTN